MERIEAIYSRVTNEQAEHALSNADSRYWYPDPSNPKANEMGGIRREPAKGHNPGLAASRREIAQLKGRLGELAMGIGLAAAAAAPAPFGTAADVISLGRSIRKGDFGGSALRRSGARTGRWRCGQGRESRQGDQ